MRRSGARADAPAAARDTRIRYVEKTVARVRDRAVVLLSGGLDSATTLAIARDEGHECMALTVLYGQRHIVEIDAARTYLTTLARDEAELRTVYRQALEIIASQLSPGADSSSILSPTSPRASSP